MKENKEFISNKETYFAIKDNAQLIEQYNSVYGSNAHKEASREDLITFYNNTFKDENATNATKEIEKNIQDTTQATLLDTVKRNPRFAEAFKQAGGDFTNDKEILKFYEKDFAKVNEAEYGEKPLGEFVREIVGLDMAAAKEAFAEYLDSVNLDASQIYFVNQIIEYIVRNGVMKDMSVLTEPPFTDKGSVVEVFTDVSVWFAIKQVIDSINANAAA